MAPRKPNPRIKKSGNAGNSGGTKEEIDALRAKLKAEKTSTPAPAAAAASAPAAASGSAGRPAASAAARSAGSASGSKKEPVTSSTAAAGASAAAPRPKSSKSTDPAPAAAASSAGGGSGGGGAGAAAAAASGAAASEFSIWGDAGDDHDTAPAKPAIITANYDLEKWTGKRPMTLLNEMCQRNHWHRPNYICDNAKGGGVTCKIILAREDPKTKERKTIFTFDRRRYVDGNEAKHFAAIYAMHQVAFDKSIHLLLPPGYRDYWLDLEDQRKADPKKKDRPCPADPFEQPSIAEEKRQERQLQAKRREREREMDPKFQLPIVRMSDAARILVQEALESVLRYSREHGVQFDAEDDDEENGAADAADGTLLLDQLTALGFLKVHVQEALQYTSTRAEALDWLCLHVPEGDLPPQYRPAHPEVQGAAHTQETLARAYKAQRLAAYGFSETKALELLPQMQDSEFAVLAHLIAELLDGAAADIDQKSLESADPAEQQAALEDEIGVLESILGKDFSVERLDEAQILSMSLSLKHVAGKTQLVVAIPQGSLYPLQPPLVTVRNDKMLAQVKLALTALLNKEAHEKCGEPMIYELVHLCEEKAPSISDHLPPLAKTPAAGTAPLLRAQLASGGSGARGKQSRAQSGTTMSKPLQARPLKRDGKVDTQLLQQEKTLQSSSKYLACLDRRRKLPAFQLRDHILQTIAKHQVVVIGGETGCGKTTQVPQFVLEALLSQGDGSVCNIICTQPRRLSATAVAERVAFERGEKIGESVGYNIRLEKRSSRDTRLLFCTTGILLRQLQADANLNGVSHVFVDEVHERSLDNDVLLALLRDLHKRRRDLKIILMSATLDASKFAAYFSGAPMLEIPGFTHPVKEFYLDELVQLTGYLPSFAQANDPKLSDAERDQQQLDKLSSMEGIDYVMVRKTVEWIAMHGDDGAVLIFMPGFAEIRKTMRELDRIEGHKLHILPLHSALTSAEQARIFDAPPAGHRKIIVSTNIAETSITIDDVTHVVDAGRMRETRYDADKGMGLLVETWVSKANAKQRRGRAGRVRPGQCYRLFTRAKYQSLAEQPDPEVLRVPLAQLCLIIKESGRSKVEEFLSTMLDSPPEASIRRALEELHNLNAIDRHERITALGKHMAQLPMDVRLAKILIFGAMLHCLDPVLTVAACMSTKSFFVAPQDKLDEANKAKQTFAAGKSDHLTHVKAYAAWVEAVKSGARAENEFYQTMFISRTTIKEVSELRIQYYNVLQELGFAPAGRVTKADKVLGGDALNINAQSEETVKAAIAAGLYPNVVRVVLPVATFTKVEAGAIKNDAESKDIRFFPRETGRVFLHPSSILFNERRYEYQHLVYLQKVATSKVFLRDASLINPYALLLFGGDLAVDHDKGLIIMDEWIKFDAPARIAVLVNKLRGAMDALLETKIREPQTDISSHILFRAIHALIQSNGLM